MYDKNKSADYMSSKLGIDDSKIPELSYVLYKTYGTTLAGLKVLWKKYSLFTHLQSFFNFLPLLISIAIIYYFDLAGYWI